MKVTPLYSFSNNRQIWRIVPAGGNIILEERVQLRKEVFFSCINLASGEYIFRDYQPAEKFWIGIESVHNGVIYFHKYAKPDMPGHKEIIAVDLYSQETLWNSDKYSFLYAVENRIYAYHTVFEGRKYVILDPGTGETVKTLEENEVDINELRFKSYDNEFFRDSFFPVLCSIEDPAVRVASAVSDKKIAGRVECIKHRGHYFLSFHFEESRGLLRNLFCIVEITPEKIIFKEVLNQKTEKFIPENFFIKGDRLYLIKEKSELKVYSLM